MLTKGMRWMLLASLMLALAGCGGGGSSTGGSGGSVTPQGTLTGTVTSSTGTAIAGARVSVGAASAVTASDGSYSLNVAAANRALVQVEAAGYAGTIRAAQVDANGSIALSAQLLPVGATQDLTVVAGGTVSVPSSTAQVVLPSNGLVRTDGGPAASSVTVAITPISPALDVNGMPGDYTTVVAGVVTPIESYGAMLITITDAAGARYNLAAGKSSTIRIPLSTRTPVASIPATIPLFYLDETTGRWVEEGSASLQGTAPNQYYEGTVTHFSYWNADFVSQTIYVSGCVHDVSDQPIASAYVVSDGIDYSGTSNTRTAEDGTFRLPIKRSAIATINGKVGSRLTNTVTAGPSAVDYTLPDCLIVSDTTGNFNVKLTWGVAPDDVDSHIDLPNQQHIYFRSQGSLIAPTHAALDVDDIDSYGPEVVTINKLMVGTYRYAVHNFSGTFNPGMTGSPVLVELNRNNTVQRFSPPAGETAAMYWWHVFDLKVAANCAVTLVPVNAWSATQPAQPTENTSTTPVYCTP